jgi:hypothetical protein
MNSALRKRVLVAGAVLAIAMTGGLVIRGSAGSAQAPDVVTTSRPAGEIPEGDRPSLPPAGSPDTTEQQPTDNTATGSGERTASADERHRLLETVGSLTIAHCYQAYLNLGLLADVRARGIYAQKEATGVLDSMLALVDSVDRTLAALDGLELDRQDRSSLDQMRIISTLLRQQGQELRAFWESGKEENAARYEDARKDSWAAISRLTGSGR